MCNITVPVGTPFSLQTSPSCSLGKNKTVYCAQCGGTEEDFVLVAHVLALDLLDSEEFLCVVQGDGACISEWLDLQNYG